MVSFLVLYYAFQVAHEIEVWLGLLPSHVAHGRQAQVHTLYCFSSPGCLCAFSLPLCRTGCGARVLTFAQPRQVSNESECFYLRQLCLVTQGRRS